MIMLRIFLAGLWYNAMMELKPSAFKIWMYCATDAPNKELTPKLMEQLFGMGRTTYYDGITDLKDKGYLIENNGLFVFRIDKDWTKQRRRCLVNTIVSSAKCQVLN